VEAAGRVMEKWPVLLMVESLGHGGCERDAAKIAIGIDRKRFEPHVAVFQEGGFRSAEVTAAGVPILYLPVRSFMNSTASEGARRMGEYIRRHGIRLVHSLDVPQNIFGAPVARMNRVPVVITSQLSYRNMYRAERRIALRATDWLSDRIVVNSQAVGDSLRRQAGFPADRIFLCYNGVDPAEFFPGPAREDGSLVVGTVCVMRPEKRVDWIVRAFAEVHREIPGLRLFLAGSGPEVPKLMELRDALGLGGVCRFEAGQPKVAGWMRGIDIFINSSTSESFPNALLEAMACGCCPIGSKVGGIPELITHGADGLVFDSNDHASLVKQLRMAAGDDGRRGEMRDRAVRTAHEKFSMRHTLDRVEGLYHELLERRGAQVAL
jgi:L-malate glycosyltransferase